MGGGVLACDAMVAVPVFDSDGLQAFQTPAEFGEVESVARDAFPFDVVPCSGGGCCRVQVHGFFWFEVA
jgi:hypothetical protein